MRIQLTLRGEEALHGLTAFFLRKVIRETLTRSFPQVFTPDRTAIIDVACVTDTEIAKLNRDYRKKTQPTDILSFGHFEGLTALLALPKKGAIDLGQIILSPEFIARSAKEDGVSWKREYTYVLSHGVLHLVGFDHEERMFDIQDAVTDVLAPIIPEPMQ
ncbi:MAG: rRNA maturation RNase YbeY [Candidatus Moraniibacteriota bacterium]|nr:MAG: rRNA maturation RNase YbeY [Candidatus Moranbacteria bacterium]